MQGDQIAFVDLAAMAQSIAATGRVALYGVLIGLEQERLLEVPPVQ